MKSPYLWSYSNHYVKGKYVADGRWDPEAVSRQCGTMVILRRLEDGGHIRVERAPRADILAGGVARLAAAHQAFEHRVPFVPLSADNDAVPGSGMEAGGDEDDGLKVGLAALRDSDSPRPVPPDDPVPFAQSREPKSSLRWPVISRHPQRLVVSYETVSGETRGRASRKFLASRSNGARHHVAIDLFAEHRDEVVACEDGTVVSFYDFYPSSAGERTYALFVEHSGCVINYGEVKSSAPQEYGWQIGSRVQAGQPIARVSTTNMLHFETYTLGTTVNQRWRPGQPRPRALLNPTAYLLALL